MKDGGWSGSGGLGKWRLTEVISILICRGEDGTVFVVAAAGAAMFAIVRILLDGTDDGEKAELSCALDNLSVFKTTVTVTVDVDVVIK